MRKTTAEVVVEKYKANKKAGHTMPAGGFQTFIRDEACFVGFRRTVITGWSPNVVEYEFADGSKLRTIGRGRGHRCRVVKLGEGYPDV